MVVYQELSQKPFLGQTSYSSVFVGVDSPFRGELVENGVVQDPKFREGRLEEGATMLASLKHFPLYEFMIQKWQDDVHGVTVFCPWIMACVASVKTELFERLNQHSAEQQASVLLELSKKLIYNSLRPLKVDGTWTLDQYVLSFNGPNIRCETIGTFFAAVGLAKMKRAPQRVENSQLTPDIQRKTSWLSR
jgi:hypothetical protein